ncbi:MAG: c-type cytochrome [Betaproteobacteria bacterium]|jgi:cytochrome c556|nr:cytochrome c [Betaproteobacteria bacterium]
MKHALIAALLGTSTLFASAPAFAQAKPEDVIKYRQGLYQVVGWQNRTMGSMVKGQAPFDAAEFSRAAEIVSLMAAVAPGAFAPGSDKGAPTRAKPEIWSDAAGFKKAMDTFQAESAKLAQIAKGAKDVDAVRSQYGALVKSCGACHDNFRTK